MSALSLTLDRMAVEEAGGSNPQRLAFAIHQQLRSLGIVKGRVPVEEIATALDIVEIRREPVNSFEGALVTTPERTTGKILVNSQSRSTRCSFTIAHELGHFLNIWHRPIEGERFVCSKKDIGSAYTSSTPGLNRHQVQEREANSFAIELLIPEYRLDCYLDSEPDLAKVVDLAVDVKCSHEAAARRFVEKHPTPLAVAFSKSGQFRYGVAGPEFGRLALRKDDPMPMLPRPSSTTRLSEIEVCDPTDWIKGKGTGEISIQTFHQMDGYAITLLVADSPDDEILSTIMDHPV